MRAKFRNFYRKQELAYLKKKFVSKHLLFNSHHFKSPKLNPILLFFLKNFYLSKKKSKTKIVRRCILVNRSRTTRKFTISRIIFRELLQIGIIPGYKKAVW